VTTVALFNNKGGVGKTTLTYHLAHMIARLGWTVLAVDMDPQANLTAWFFDETELERLWEGDGAETIFGCIRPIVTGTGDIATPVPREVADRLFVLPGDLGLARFEDKLSQEWTNILLGKEGPLRTTTSFHRLIRSMAQASRPDITLIDVGPNQGAINRAALLAANWILVPLAADLFSLQGLRNLGPTVSEWRKAWELARSQPSVGLELPDGAMQPLGYVVLQPPVRLDRPVKAFQRWLERIPGEFHRQLAGQHYAGRRPDQDPYQLAILRNYRSLMPLAQDARKPMFDLRAADGALGSTARFVQICYQEFEGLARRLMQTAGISTPRVHDRR
jgi:chromosome partitioning protein